MTRHQFLHAWILLLSSTTPLVFAAESPTPGEPRVQAADHPADVALADSVYSRILYDDILRHHAGNLRVSARNGLVTLSGSVSRDTIRGRMTTVAKTVKGVGRVVNLLTVDPN